MTNDSKKLVLERIPKLSWVLVFVGFIIGSIYTLVSIIRFGFQYYDPSQLVSNIAIGLAVGGWFFIFAYIYWYFRNNDSNILDINKDFQSVLNRLSGLENNIIEIKQNM